MGYDLDAGQMLTFKQDNLKTRLRQYRGLVFVFIERIFGNIALVSAVEDLLISQIFGFIV